MHTVLRYLSKAFNQNLQDYRPAPGIFKPPQPPDPATHPNPYPTPSLNPRPRWDGRAVMHCPQHGQLWCWTSCGDLIQGA